MSEKTPTVQYRGPNTGIGSSTGLDFCLISEGEQIGKFWFDEDSKTIKFEGNADESAKIFIESSTLILQTWVDNKNIEIDALSSEISDLKGIQKKYLDLIYEVAQKYPEETRHETAKRYIRERENRPHCEGSNTVSDTRG